MPPRDAQTSGRRDHLNQLGSMSILKASVTDVKIGPVSIKGLMSENGEFGVAIPQMADLDLIPSNRSAKALKALTGEAFQTNEIQKWKTPIHPKAVNVVTLEAFAQIVLAMSERGNPAARKFVRSMFGLSLHQLFSDAFGLKFEADDRQRWLVERLATRHDFRPLTDQLKAHGFTSSRDYQRFVWAMQSKAGVKSGERDTVPAATLVNLNRVQVRLTTLMECGINPWDAGSGLVARYGAAGGVGYRPPTISCLSGGSPASANRRRRSASAFCLSFRCLNSRCFSGPVSCAKSLPNVSCAALRGLNPLSPFRLALN